MSNQLDLHQLYEGELIFVRKLAQEFAGRYPATAGRLESDLPPAHTRWFLAQLALLAVVVFLAIPFGTRRSRRLT